MILIEKSTYPHGTESRDDLDFHWLEPYRPGEFAVLPTELTNQVTACAGYCDLDLADYIYTTDEPREVTEPDTGEVTVEMVAVTHTIPQGLVTAITAHEVPPRPEPEPDIQTALTTFALASMGLQVDTMAHADAGVTLLKAAGIAPASDATAPWKAGEYVTIGAVRTIGDVAYLCIYAHLTGDHWHPTKTTGHVWVIEVTEEGTPDNPIPFVMGMAVKQGLHYSYQGKVYKWIAADHPSCSWAPGSAGTGTVWEVVG